MIKTSKLKINKLLKSNNQDYWEIRIIVINPQTTKSAFPMANNKSTMITYLQVYTLKRLQKRPSESIYLTILTRVIILEIITIIKGLSIIQRITKFTPHSWDSTISTTLRMKGPVLPTWYWMNTLTGCYSKEEIASMTNFNSAIHLRKFQHNN